MAGCVPVGLIKCYLSALNPNSVHTVGTLQYLPCSLIDGVTPDTSHIGKTVRLDNTFSDINSNAWTVYSVDPNTAFPNATPTAPLTTNATCTPVVVDGCTDSTATNYNPNATIDDGSCIYPLVGCMMVGMVKCYAGITAGGAHPVGSLSYLMCPLIDGVLAEASHIGEIVRYDGPFSPIDTDAWEVVQVTPNTMTTSSGYTLTTNATCTPAAQVTSSDEYLWDQVKVLQPDGSYKAYIFSPLYYDDYNSNNYTANAYITLDDRGAFRCTRGDNGGAFQQRVSYLFVREDGDYSSGPGPDDPAHRNQTIDQRGELFNMWSPGMPMEGIFPEVGEIVKITDLQLDYNDAVWYNSNSPWNHVLPDGSLQSNSWPQVAPQRDWVCLQVIAVITKTQFDSNTTFLPSQTTPVINGPPISPFNYSHLCVQKQPPYTPGGGAIVEGCKYHDRPIWQGGIMPHNVTHGGIGHITLYMKPDPTWSGLTGNQTVGIQDGDCYDVIAYKIDEDHSFPEISMGGLFGPSYVREQWNPRLMDEGPTSIPTNMDTTPPYPTTAITWTDDSCNIHCPVRHFDQNSSQPCWTRGYKVPYNGRYRIRYDAEVYQSHGNAWTDPSWWTAWVTIDRQIVTWSNSVTGMPGGIGIKFSNPNNWGGTGVNGGVGWGSHSTQQSYYGPTGYMPTLPPWNAALTSASYGIGGGFAAHWPAEDSNGNYRHRAIDFEINLKKGMEVQIVFKGENQAQYHTNYGRIRRQYFRVRPVITHQDIMVWDGPFNNNYPAGGNWSLRNNYLPPPDALCYDVPTTQTWLGHPSLGGTSQQHNGGILAQPGHDWDCCYHCNPLSGWTGTTIIYPEEGCAECLKIPSWNCDLSLSYLPVTIDPDKWWKISGQGCIDPGDGSGTYKSFSGYTGGYWDSCISQCNPTWWDCDGNGGCNSASTVAPVNAYWSEAVCVANCVIESWDCDMTQGVCYDPGTGLGQYTSLSNCNTHCHATTWNCGGAVGGTPGVCYQSNGPSGQYMTLTACQSNCFPDTYNCVLGSCVNPGDGTGLYASLVLCKDMCSDNEPCSVYLSTISKGIYTEPGGTVFNNGIHNICVHDLWYYDVTAATTTWVMKLPQTIGFGFSDSCYYRNGIASTKTKFWTYRAIDGECIIKEYDINQTDPTILVHNRDIDILSIVGTYQQVSTIFLAAIDNKTLILAKKDQNSTGLMVVNLDIHPVSGVWATDKFIIPGFMHDSDVTFLPSESAIFVSDETGQIRKYDYIGGTLLSSFTPLHDLDGLFMHEGNIYATSSVTNKKFLVDKQTCATTFISYLNIPTPYTTGGLWQTALNIPPTITLGGTIQGDEVSITNASSSPCCDNDQTNCGACLETLSQYMPSTGVNFIQYQSTMPGAQYGDCVSDPGGCCYCCTFADAPSPIAPPSNASSRLYTTTLSYVDGISKNNEKVKHLEEIKRWIVDPRNLSQKNSWNSMYFAKRNNEYEKGECGDDFEAISLFSLTISVSGVSHTFEDTSTWSDVLTYSSSLGARVDKSMTWDKYIKVMYGSFGENSFTYSTSEISCGCYNEETKGPKAKAKSFPCAISNGNYIDLQGQWRECDVDIHGNDCSGTTMNWGCCGGNMLSSLYIGSICDNRQGICPSGCAKIDTGYVGYDTESFFEWYTQVANGFYATDIRDIKYILNNIPNQYSYPCYENSVGWWYNFSDQFGVAWTSTTGTVTAHLNSYGTLWFSTWLDFITAIFSNNFATINLGATFNQLLNYPYQTLMNKLQLLQPGFAMHFHGSPCKCDGVECVQNVPKPDGYLTKDDCQNSYLINDCPHSDQRCTPDPWRCVKRQVPIADAAPGSSTVYPNYKCFCVQDGGGNYTTPSYATEELCKEASNCCLPETYNCKTSESDCVGKTLLPHIVGRWWNGTQATNTVTSTPIGSSTELFSNAMFGQQSTDIRNVRWEYSLLPANTISSDDCIPTSPLALVWAAGSNPPLSPQAPWIVVTGLEFKDPYESSNVNNSLGLPGLPVYTWLEYIDLLNTYGVGTTITPNMSAAQVGSIIGNYMGWGSVTHGVSWRRCQCDPFTTNCHCVDPGDGSGTYSSLQACKNNPINCCGSAVTHPPIQAKLKPQNIVQFPISDITNGIKEAKERGYNGDEEEVLDIYAKLNGTDGTPSADLGLLNCKKCGGGFGICGKGACIGITKDEDGNILINITIPI